MVPGILYARSVPHESTRPDSSPAADEQAVPLLWLAQCVSLIGDFFNLTALQTLVSSGAPAGATGQALGILFLNYTLRPSSSARSRRDRGPLDRAG